MYVVCTGICFVKILLVLFLCFFFFFFTLQVVFEGVEEK
jgi:hypothetical protein